MNRRLLLFITLPLLLITIVLIALYYYAAQTRAADDLQAISASHDNSGTQFLLEQKPVQVELDGIPNAVQLSDSFGPTLRLRSFSPPSTGGLANEHDGTLTPALSLTGCQVSSLQADPKDTNDPIDAFVWHWSVRCASAGKQDLQVSLKFAPTSGALNGADRTAYRHTGTVRVTQPLSLERVAAGLGIVSTLLTLITAAAGLFGKRRPAPT